MEIKESVLNIQTDVISILFTTVCNLYATTVWTVLLNLNQELQTIHYLFTTD